MTAFRLIEKTEAHDSLATHKELWAAAMERRENPSIDFDGILAGMIATGRVLMLPAGTELILTGRATAMSTEVSIPGRDGTWCIANFAVKQAGIPVPPVDDSYLREQLP